MGLALVLPLAAGAAEFRGGETVSFGDTVRENVYAAGGTLNVAGVVDGDLYVAGGTVNLMGTVTKDVVVVGGTLIVTGQVGGDLRIIGGNVTVGGDINGELAAAGGNVNVLPGTMISDGAYFAAGSVNMNGSVGRDLVIAGGQITLSSSVKVGGNFDYYSQNEAKIESGAKIGGAINFHQQAAKNYPAAKAPVFGWIAFMTFWGLVGLAGAVIISCLLFYLWRQESKEMIEAVFAAPGKELLRGFVTFFILPIAAIVCMITLIGLPLGFLAIVVFALLAILGAATSGLIWAALIARFIFRRKETDINWWLIIIAVLVLALVKLIPFIGWLIGFLVFLTGFGVLSNTLYEKLMSRK